MAQPEPNVHAQEPEPQPLIISGSEHPIRRKHIDKEAIKVLSRLHSAGHKAYLVGGGVRDLYLGKRPKDFDISTDARPGELRKIFRNSRTIGRRFRLVQIFFSGNKIIEVSTFRCRSEYDIEGGESVLPANNTFGTVADDAFRRDLTINSLFFDIETESIIDYTGGVSDLDEKIIRMVGDPDRRIIRDPVRMLRAIRHAARSGFTVHDDTWKAILDHREKLSLCPISRIRDEFLKDLRGGASSDWLQLALDSGLFYSIFPFYRETLEEEGEKNQILLSSILGVIDRLHNEKQRMQDALLFALILIPWAQANFPEMSKKLKNGEIFALSRSIRLEFDKILGHLNIKRSSKEHIASLLSHLNLFTQNDNDGKWPAWLKKKSYFRESSQFYLIYREATGGKPVSSLKLPRSTSKSRPKRRKPRRGRGPAFARSSQKGGVFGFKRK